MKKQNKSPATNFWFGFSFGVASMAGAAYLLGTANGREKLKKLMEFAEQHNLKTGEIFEMVQNMTEETKKKEAPEHKNNLESIIDRVRNITLEKKT